MVWYTLCIGGGEGVGILKCITYFASQEFLNQYVSHADCYVFEPLSSHIRYMSFFKSDRLAWSVGSDKQSTIFDEP